MPKFNAYPSTVQLNNTDIMLADTQQATNTRKIAYSDLRTQLQNESKSVFALKGEVATDEQVADAVGDWLEEHVTPTMPTVLVDDTLSIEDAAAEAKATGDAIDEVSNSVDSLETQLQSTKTADAYGNLLWLFNENSLPVYEKNGITYTYLGNDTFSVDGETTTNISFYAFLTSASDFDNLIERGKSYYLEYETDDDNVPFQVGLLINGTWSYYFYTKNTIITVPENCEDMLFRIRIATNLTIDNATIKVRLSKMPFDRIGEKTDLLKMMGKYPYSDRQSANISFSYSKDTDSFTINGTSNNTASFPFLITTDATPVFINGGDAFYLDYSTTDTHITFQLIYYINGSVIYKHYTKSGYISIPDGAYNIGFRLYIANGRAINNATVEAHLYMPVPNHELVINQERNNDNNAVVIYTSFEKNDGFWLSDGSFDSLTNHKHTQLLPLKPKTVYYFSTTAAMLTTYDCFGMFYDADKNPISVLPSTDISKYEYDVPNKGEAGTFTYVEIYKFTTPDNVYYLSMNIPQAPAFEYRNYLSTIPVFAGEIYGDLTIKNDDPIYQKNKDRKLCIIGTSQIMIDRLSRTGKFDGPSSSDTTEFVIGLQEYLMPWWKTVDSYGYSSAAMMYRENETIKSLYTRVVTDKLDIADYDDYFITHSSSSLTSESDIGSLSDMTDMGDNTKFIGALRQIINYIYTLNPNANIFVQTRIIRNVLENSERLAVINSANQKIRELADMLAITCVDTAFDSGFNYYNAPYWCYDANGHPNQVGNHYIGLSMRKAMMGF